MVKMSKGTYFAMLKKENGTSASLGHVPLLHKTHGYPFSIFRIPACQQNDTG